MTKQVNLNSQRLLPGFGPVQLPFFMVVILISLMLGIAWFFYSWSERQTLLEEELRWVEILKSEQLALTTFQAQYPNVNNEPELQAKNEALTTQLARARETYSGLANQVENAIEGFNAPLVQLSDYDLNGLWLDKISLKDGKRYFSLEGFARTPELIPLYLEQLGESTFQGITIEQLAVAKQENTDLWHFTMSNEQATSILEGQR
jgi:MSHA biogenesis protein MshI